MTKEHSILVIAGFISNPSKFHSHVEPIANVGEVTTICINPNSTTEGFGYIQVPTYHSKLIGLLFMLIYGMYYSVTKEYDLIVSYSLIPYGLFGLLTGFISRTPVHLGIIGGDLDIHARGKSRWPSQFVRWCFRQFDTISVKGSSYEGQLTTYGVPSSRIFQLFNPPAQEFEAATPSPEPKYDLLWLTRMSPEKNPLLFIKLLTELRHRDVEFTATMVGAGPMQEEVRNAVNKKGLEDVVDLPGWSDNPIEFFEESSIYVLTSDRDMLPISLLEAMYCGDVPVAPAIGAIPDIIGHQKNGILVEENHVQEYADNLEDLLSNKETRRELSKQAIKIREEISHDASKKTWLDILKYVTAR